LASLILLFCCQKESATTPKRIFEKIYPYYSFVAQAFYQLIFYFFVLEKWKRGLG